MNQMQTCSIVSLEDKKMTAEKLSPRLFQLKVRELLMKGKSVILQAPTGAGKTDAALWPFIQNLEQDGNALPRTCLYATPMRVLSNQFYEKYRHRIARLDKERGKNLVTPFEHLGRTPVSIQTGEQPDDPQFESILTFCTIDQLLASFLAVPYSIDKRRTNINVGAIASSYLVLDEFHLYPLLQGEKSCFGARTTTISMLRLLRSITPFILMTATFSNALLNELKELLDSEIVTVTNEQELNIISEGRARTFELATREMDAEAILARHDKCSLVICNTVLRAQQQFLQIKERAKKLGIEVKLLHSRLTAEDRAARSKEIMHELSKAPETWQDDKQYGWKDGVYYGKNMIVIATQVVEVGLDISVQTLHTEIAPANSLIQRAGRCARFAKQQGTVFVYDLPFDATGKRVTTLPYEKYLCDATLKALESFDKQIIGFNDEQALIDVVHTQADRDLLERYKSNKGHITNDIFRSLNENERGIVTTLIRDVAQVQILIHDNPQEMITEEPWKWQHFAMHPGSLAGRWEALEKRASQLGLDWVCKEAIPLKESDGDEADSRKKTKYTWQDIPSSGKTDAIARKLREALMVVLPGELATYDKELGFVLLDERLNVKSTGYQSTPLEKEKKKSKFDVLKHQTYQEHISGLVKAYDSSIKHNLQYVVHRLQDLMGLPQGSVDQAIRLAIACHDLGKLGRGWQQWAWNWQTLLFKEKGWPLLPDQPYFFAKTDFDYSSSEHRRLRDTMAMKRPPHHACEGVALGMNLIAESLGVTEPGSKEEPLLRAVCGAIAHHHTSSAHEFQSIQLQQGALEAVKQALEDARQQGTWVYDLSLVDMSSLESGDLAPANAPADITRPKQGRLHEPEAWLYFVIVRALRLADQRAGLFSKDG